MSKGDWDQGLSASTASADFDSCHLSCYPELETIDLRPVAAIRLLDNLFVNAGLEAMSPGVVLNPCYSSFPQFWSDGFGSQMNTGDDGWSWGNIGLTWNISKRQHLFMTYRSPVEADDSGRFAADPFMSAAEAFPNRFNPAFSFPTALGIGYGIALTETISLETDFALLDFLENQSLYFNTLNDPVLLTMGAKSASTPENPHNILASGVGADWKFAAHWALRARYDFFENPGHNSAFSPTTPDVNQHVITLGVAWKGKKQLFGSGLRHGFLLRSAHRQRPATVVQWHLRLQRAHPVTGVQIHFLSQRAVHNPIATSARWSPSRGRNR